MFGPHINLITSFQQVGFDVSKKIKFLDASKQY